ncbi:MAG: DUF2997 domain-containing protein [Candidatus Omnitrophica bacterium]|nr:DUF2997 domain-containing protein [Candidatus Omnitrophota bacterium]
MVRREEIELLISPEGEVKFVIRGIVGSGCEQVAKNLAKDLGELRDWVKTTEYYQLEEKRTIHSRKTDK